MLPRYLPPQYLYTFFHPDPWTGPPTSPVEMGGKAKPTKHTSAELKAREKVATQSRGGGTSGIEERSAKTNIKGAPCQEPGCCGLMLTSLTVRRAATTQALDAAPAILMRAGRCPTQVCKTHWSNKHCTCRRADCECFPAATYEPFFAKAEKVMTHHNQTATLASNKNASKSVRDKLKAQQIAAAAAICDESRKKTHAFTAKQGGPSTK